MEKSEKIGQLIGSSITSETANFSGLYLRSCEETINPIEGKVSGEIPKWIKGNFMKNGPGTLSVGENLLNHIFDGMAVLQSFKIENGNVTYQSKFLESDAYKSSKETNMLKYSEFGTAVPKSSFERMQSLFKESKASDNTSVSIYPFEKEFFAMSEIPLMNNFDPVTLRMLKTVNLAEYIDITTQTAHPHIDSDGNMYNMCLITNTDVKYAIVYFPGGSIKNSKIVATLPARWKLNPCYMHSFGITENYFIIIEQPFVISVKRLLTAKLTNKPISSCFKWFSNEQVKISVIERKSGELKYEFYSEPFFFFHTINHYEIDGHIVLDMTCFKNPKVIDEFFTKNLQNANNNLEFIQNTRARPLRFVLPLKNESSKSSKKPDVSNQNLVTLENSSASAFYDSKGSIICEPELLCDVGCDACRFHYEGYLGKKYKYFYASCTDKEADCKISLFKVDADKKTISYWYEEGAFTGEPIFVPSPDAQEEDDGVVLSSITWLNDENRLTFLVLNAKNMKELGRSEFRLNSPVPTPFHGWFA